MNRRTDQVNSDVAAIAFDIVAWLVAFALVGFMCVCLLTFG